MKVAIYLRVSTKDQHTENQLLQLRQYAEQQGWQVYKIYQDHESGKKGKREREGFAAMLADAKKQRFDKLLFWALDRLTREGMFKTINYLQILDTCDVTFHSFTEPFLNTDNELVRSILISVLSSLAKVEVQKRSDRTKAGMERARKQGKQIGRKDKSELKPEIARLKAEGLSDGAVMRELGISRNTLKKYKAVA
jgi:DNA invertase Pin-like site-specific DNA recombinase